jgi:BASS family bile acid:Na+ symporter
MKSTLTIITALLAEGRAWDDIVVLNMRDIRTVAFEVGLQNGGMATGLAFNVLHSPSAALASATFGPWSAITSSALASWWSRRSIPQDT